ncbi:MAG: hypothetical protein ABFD04_02900 [Syntrophomonas sp.]
MGYSISTNKYMEALQSVRNSFTANNKKIAMLYSGGKDSTAVLLAIAKEFPEAQLYLYALNNGCMYPEEVKGKIVEKLDLFRDRGLVKNKIEAIYFDMREMMAYLGFRTFSDDMARYPTGLLCCSCKLIMHFITARYSQQIGVSKIADGYSYFERFLPEQTLEFRSVVEGPIAEKYGVKMISPLYSVFDGLDAPMQIISGFGLDPKTFLGENQGQGVCMLGMLYTIPYDVNNSDEPTNQFFTAMKKAVVEYTSDKPRFISGRKTQQLIMHDSYGNERLADIPYDQLMDKIIAAKEIFFEN